MTQNRYVYVGNNPLGHIDLLGMDEYFLVDRGGAGGQGHVGTIVGNPNYGYYFFSQGQAGGDGVETSQLAFTSTVPAGVTVTWGPTPLHAAGAMAAVDPKQTYDASKRISTSEQQDLDMIIYGMERANYFINFNSNSKSHEGVSVTPLYQEAYNLITNNCATFSGDISSAGGVSTPLSFLQKPNSWFDWIQ